MFCIQIIEEQNPKMLNNHNDLKTSFRNLSKKPAHSQTVQDKYSKISRTENYLEAYERGILIIDEKEISKEADGREGNRVSDRIRTFTSSDTFF